MAGDAARYHFDIAAQPLQSALDAYAALTGSSVFYAAETVAGRQSAAVEGDYVAGEALRLLLEGTGVAVHYTAEDAFVLEAVLPAPSVSVASPQLATMYGSLLQSRVRSAFCGDAVTRPGNYRVALRFHVDERGDVRRPILLSSTGNDARDRRILAVLHDLRVGSAPADPSQPFVMLIEPGDAAAAECGRASAPP